MLARLHPMHLDMIRLAYGFQGMPLMSWLTTTLFPMSFPQALRGRFGQPITRGRFATIPAVFGNPIFQGL